MLKMVNDRPRRISKQTHQNPDFVYTNVIASEPKPTPTKANVNSTEHGHGDNSTSPAARAMLALSSVFRRASHSTATQTPISNQITDNHQAAMQTKITQLQHSNILNCCIIVNRWRTPCNPYTMKTNICSLNGQRWSIL